MRKSEMPLFYSIQPVYLCFEYQFTVSILFSFYFIFLVSSILLYTTIPALKQTENNVISIRIEYMHILFYFLLLLLFRIFLINYLDKM